MIILENPYLLKEYQNLDKSLYFDKIDDYIEFPDWKYKYLNNGHDWSISLRIKFTDLSSDNHILDAITSNKGWFLTFNNASSVLRFSINDTGIISNETNFDFNHTFIENVWYNITITYTPTNIKLYVNTVLDNTIAHTIADFENIGNDIFVGSNRAGTSFFGGNICYIYILNEEYMYSEIAYNHDYIGYLLRDSSFNVVFYLSFQEDNIIADTDFITINPEFSVSDIIILEESYKYNGLKPFGTNTIASFANNGVSGTTVNYTSHNLQEGDVINIYNTSSYNGTHKIFNVLTNSFDIPTTFVGIETSIGRWGSSISKSSHGKINGKTDIELGITNKSTNTNNLDFYSDSTLKDGALLFTDLTQYLSFSSTTDWDNIVYEGTAVLSLNIGSSRIDVSTLGYVTYLEIRDASDVVLSSFSLREVSGTTVTDLTTTNDATLVNWGTEEVLVGGGAWINKKNQIPKNIEFADCSSTINFRASGLTGTYSSPSNYFSLIFTFKEKALIASNNDRIIEITDSSNNPIFEIYQNGNTQFRITANRAGQRDFVYVNEGLAGTYANAPKCVRFDQFNTFIFNYKEMASNEYLTESVFINGIRYGIGNTPSDGNLILDFSIIDKISINSLYTGSLTGDFKLVQFGIFEGSITQKQAVGLNIINTPEKELLDKAIIYAQFNSGTIYDDGIATNPVIKDLSINNIDLEVFGLTGATKALKIVDYRTNFAKNINQNR